MKEDKRIKLGILSNADGRILNEALWEMETCIDDERKLISNFVIENGERDMNSLRKDMKTNLRNKRAICNNNSDVELLDKFIRLHEKEIEKIRKFEI
jgi:hypothetical protein